MLNKKLLLTFGILLAISIVATLALLVYFQKIQIKPGESKKSSQPESYPVGNLGNCEASFYLPPISSPSPSPSVSPSPSPSPSPNPIQCLALGSDLIPEPGTSLSLICSGSGIASDNPAGYRAEFKLSYSPDGTTEYSFSEDLGQVDLDIDSAQAQTSYSVPSDLEDGYYHIECRICDKATGETCTAWGQAY